MDSALTPDLALAYLRELSADVRAGVVLDTHGGRLAGPPELAEAAGELARLCFEAVEVQLETRAGHVFAARSERHFVLVAAGRFALAGLVRHDLRAVLAGLAPDTVRDESAVPSLRGASRVPPAARAVGGFASAHEEARRRGRGRGEVRLRSRGGGQRILDESDARTAALRRLAQRLQLAAGATE